MTAWKTYHLSDTIEDALQALSGAQGSARLVAGGTDLLLDLQQGRHPPLDLLVDITRIPELNRLELRPDGVYVGAATPLNKLVASPLLQQHAPALVDACGLIGGPQVRNTATLGGNVAHALPAGDGTIAALALDAQAELADGAGRRFVPLETLFLGPGRSALDARREVLVGFLLPRRAPGQGSAHRRVMRPQGVAIAILNMAVWLERRQERIAQVRVALGPAGPRPLRARAAEAALLGKAPEAGVIADAVQALLGEASFRTSPHRATAEYRRSVAAWLLEQTLLAAWERAAAGAQD